MGRVKPSQSPAVTALPEGEPRGCAPARETERIGTDTLHTLFYDRPSKDRCAGFAILSYFSPIRILASSELASRMTVFSSPFRLAFRASSARENS